MAIGKTLYGEYAETKDVGLTLTSGAPIVVVQNESYEKANGTTGTRLTYTEYSTIAQALNAVANKNAYVGHIAAALNDKGTAEWIVLKSETAVGIKTDNGTTPVNNGLTINQVTYANSEFSVNITTEGAIAAGAKWSVTMTNKDGDKLASNSGVIQNAKAAGETFDISVPYAATNGTGTYTVTVKIGNLSVVGNYVVA